MRLWELLVENQSGGRASNVIALAIHAMTDLPIVALMVGNDGERQQPAYMMVRASEDTFLDAYGSRALVEIMNDAGFDPHGGQKWEVREITPEMLLQWSNGKRFPVITKSMASQAKQQAHDILSRLGISSH